MLDTWLYNNLEFTGDLPIGIWTDTGTPAIGVRVKIYDVEHGVTTYSTAHTSASEAGWEGALSATIPASKQVVLTIQGYTVVGRQFHTRHFSTVYWGYHFL